MSKKLVLITTLLVILIEIMILSVLKLQYNSSNDNSDQVNASINHQKYCLKFGCFNKFSFS